jgi:hypothetical protein
MATLVIEIPTPLDSFPSSSFLQLRLSNFQTKIPPGPLQHQEARRGDPDVEAYGQYWGPSKGGRFRQGIHDGFRDQGCHRAPPTRRPLHSEF